MRAETPPIGVVLAGGRARRMGGDKLGVALCGRALIEYPLLRLRAVLPDVVVIAKPDVRLPELPGVTVWLEPEEPRHPVVGLAEALGLAAGRAIMVLAGDMPLVSPSLIERIICTAPAEALATLATCRGRLQPLVGLYRPAAASILAPAARGAHEPLRRIVADLHPAEVEVSDPNELFNVNAPEDLLIASGLLRQAQVDR